MAGIGRNNRYKPKAQEKTAGSADLLGNRKLGF